MPSLRDRLPGANMSSKFQVAIRSLGVSLKIFLIGALLTLPVWAGQSLRLNGSQTATNSSVSAQGGNSPCRWEFQVSWTGFPSGSPAHADACGLQLSFVAAGPGYFQIANNIGGPVWGCCYLIPTPSFISNWAIVRFQQIPSGAGGTMTWEAWDINGVRQVSHTATYSSTRGGHANGASVTSTPCADTSWGFFRLLTTTVPLGSAEPTFADTGDLLDWRFDNNLNDSSKHHYNASGVSPARPCGSAPCYEASLGQTLVTSVIKTSPAPVWSNFQSWRAGTTAGLDGSASVSMGDSSSTPTLQWQIISGPSTPIWSSHTSTKPTLTGIVFGNYRIQLVATNANGRSAMSQQDIGAVAYDDNGVVIPANPRVSDIFGPQIAFGQNPWGWEDERNLKTILSQPAYQATHMDTTWQTTNASGTISYPFSGKGLGPGPSCTTLSSPITTATQTTIAVTDASCLSLVGLPGEPTWIMVGTSLSAFELIRICSATAVSGPATLTVCYDGRGMSGNTNNANSPVPAQTWTRGALVGEFRIQGTGTLFSTDATRAVCPAGLPGPMGQVMYSTGTVRLSAGSKLVTATSGTPFTAGNGVKAGGYVRIAATHDGGIPFIFWGQIVSFTSTVLTIDRPAPAGMDAGRFNFKITSVAGSPDDPTGMLLMLEFNAPDRAGTHVARLLFNGYGCESETAMFSVGSRDIGALNSTVMSGLKYSYEKFQWAYSAFGSNFYGMGLAARNFYYRSGYGPALDLANSIDEHYATSPEIAEGYGGGSPLIYGAGVIGSIVDLALNGSTTLTWKNMENLAKIGEIGGNTCNQLDTREGGYQSAWLTLAANYSTDSTNRTAYKNALGLSSSPRSLLGRDQLCRRNASDGYIGAEINSFANTDDHAGPKAQPLVLTKGSTAVTGSGFTSDYCGGVDTGTIHVTNGSSVATVISGTLTQQTKIYITDTTSSPLYLGVFAYSFISGSDWQLGGIWPAATGTFSFMNENIDNFSSIWSDTNDNPISNHAQEKNWACQFNSSSSLTLNRAWDGPSSDSSHTFYIYSNVGATFFQQPFMLGIKTNQLRWASLNDDPSIAAGNSALLPLIGEWQNAYGYDSLNTHGSFYISVMQACMPQTVLAAGSFTSIHGTGCGDSTLSKDVARVLSVEGGAAMIAYYLASPTPTRRTIVDAYYGAIFGYIQYCATSVLSTCDGVTAGSATDTDLSTFKWPGFFFGMGGFFANSWPAVRLGVEAPVPRTLNVTCNISNVANAARCRVTLTKPDGSMVINTCPAGPCAVTADAREGDHLLKVEYLNALGAVLAAGEPEPVRVN